MTGQKISRVVTSIAGNMDIEDMWLPFFLHLRQPDPGRDESALIGQHCSKRDCERWGPRTFPPVTWDNQFLVDGALVNLVPSDVMRDFVGQGTAVSVDVSAPVEYGEVDFGLSFTGWEGLRRRFELFTRSQRVPGLLDLLMRSPLESVVPLPAPAVSG